MRSRRCANEEEKEEEEEGDEGEGEEGEETDSLFPGITQWEDGRDRTKTHLVLINGLIHLGVTGHGHGAHELPILLSGLCFFDVDGVFGHALGGQCVVGRRILFPLQLPFCLWGGGFLRRFLPEALKGFGRGRGGCGSCGGIIAGRGVALCMWEGTGEEGWED